MHHLESPGRFDSVTNGKAAQKAAAEWEQQAKEEYKQDVRNPELVREREIERIRTEFSHFVRDIWYPICTCDGEHKPTTIDFNRNISNVIADYFSGKALQSISAIDIDKYLIYLHTKYRTKQGKPLAAKRYAITIAPWGSLLPLH